MGDFKKISVCLDAEFVLGKGSHPKKLIDSLWKFRKGGGGQNSETQEKVIRNADIHILMDISMTILYQPTHENGFDQLIVTLYTLSNPFSWCTIVQCSLTKVLWINWNQHSY